MIPIRLNDWTFEIIEALCAAGQSESDRHDFKFDCRFRGITRYVCAFANTYGGFLIIGVSDKTNKKFEPTGVLADKELYGKLVSKIRADPDITVASSQIDPCTHI